MRSLFLGKSAGSKATSKYRAVKEEEDHGSEEIPLMDFGFEVRDDFDRRSQSLSYDVLGDPRRTTLEEKSDEIHTGGLLSSRMELPPAADRFFPHKPQSLQHGFTKEVVFFQGQNKYKGTDYENELQSVTSLYYDDHVDYDDGSQQLIRASETEEVYLVSSHSQGEHQEIYHSQSVESSFPVDPNRWLASSSTSSVSSSGSDVKAITKLLFSPSEDGTESSTIFAQAVFPNDPFGTEESSSDRTNIENSPHLQSESKGATDGAPDAVNPFDTSQLPESLEGNAQDLKLPVLPPKVIQWQEKFKEKIGEVSRNKESSLSPPRSDDTNIIDDVDEAKEDEAVERSDGSPILKNKDSDESSSCYVEDEGEGKHPKLSVDDKKEVEATKCIGTSTCIISPEASVCTNDRESLHKDATIDLGYYRKKCRFLEEEMMLLKAQHQTELMERDFHDEEIFQNMALMQDIIERLETSDRNVSIEDNTMTPLMAKRGLEVQLEQFDEEIEHRANRRPWPKSQDTADKSEKAPTNLPVNEDEPHLKTSENEELVRQLEEEKTELIRKLEMVTREAKAEKKTLADCIEGLRRENKHLKMEVKETQEILKPTLFENKTGLLPQQEEKVVSSRTTDSTCLTNYYIIELEEERTLLQTKIQSQDAAVALMKLDEEELKQQVNLLKDKVHVLLSSGTSVPAKDTGFTEDRITEQDFVIKDLRAQLEESQSLRLAQGDTISNLLCQVQTLTQRAPGKIDIVDNNKDFHKYNKELKALEVERDQWRAKCIVLERTLAKLQRGSGSFLLQSIEEDKELGTDNSWCIEHFGTLSQDSKESEKSDESLYAETKYEKKILSRKPSGPPQFTSTSASNCERDSTESDLNSPVVVSNKMCEARSNKEKQGGSRWRTKNIFRRGQ